MKPKEEEEEEEEEKGEENILEIFHIAEVEVAKIFYAMVYCESKFYGLSINHENREVICSIQDNSVLRYNNITWSIYMCSHSILRPIFSTFRTLFALCER